MADLIVEEKVTKVTREVAPAPEKVTRVIMARRAPPKEEELAARREAHMIHQGRIARGQMVATLTTAMGRSCVSHGAARQMDARRFARMGAPMLASGVADPIVASTAKMHQRSMAPWRLVEMDLVDRGHVGARFRPQQW
jgi:hypothetical protein